MYRTVSLFILLAAPIAGLSAQDGIGALLGVTQTKTQNANDEAVSEANSAPSPKVPADLRRQAVPGLKIVDKPQRTIDCKPKQRDTASDARQEVDEEEKVEGAECISPNNSSVVKKPDDRRGQILSKVP